MNRPIVVFDTETAARTGAPHLLELGAVRVVEGEIVDTFDRLVRPPVPIEPAAGLIHGIGDDDVRDADDAGAVLAEFTAWVADDWMAAHDAPADVEVLAFESARSDTAGPPALVIEIRRLARQLLSEAPDHDLETLGAHLELEDANRRSALADAVTAWKVLEECLERAGGLESAEAANRLLTSRAPITVEAARPRTPHLSPRLRPLRDAAAAGESVTLLYGGADGPPARLPVVPRFLFERRGKAYLEGECESSGQLKTYLLERVRKVMARVGA